MAISEVAPNARRLPPTGRLITLQPEQISGLLGRWHGASFLMRMKPRTRFVLIGLGAAVVLLILAYLDRGLTSPRGVRTTIGVILNPASRPVQVSLALLQDPVGLVAFAVTLLTPVLFAEQVTAIQEFNPANEGNIGYRADSLECEQITEQIERANNRFRRIGGRAGSVLVLVLSAACSSIVNYLINRRGLFPELEQDRSS